MLSQICAAVVVAPQYEINKHEKHLLFTGLGTLLGTFQVSFNHRQFTGDLQSSLFKVV
jgi:hypothetical protein